MFEQKATEWVNSYGDMLYRYALPRVSDSDIAKDLVQETFLAAWRNIEKFKGEISEKNWLFTILKNKIIDHYRKAVNRLTDSFPGMADEDSYFEDSGHWAKEAQPREWGIDYNNSIESKEFYEVLEKCKSRLKEMQNAVFTMKYLDGMESEEICKELNITPSNYWVLLHRAKAQLRGCLEKKLVYPMSMKTLNINCRKAAEYMCKKEEGALTFWQRFRLSYHLLVCGVCRTFEQQDNWLRNNVSRVDEHCKGCLSEEEKQRILQKLKEEVS